MAARWTFLSADLISNAILGELPFGGSIKMSKVLNGAGQVQAEYNIGDARWSGLDVLDWTEPARRVLYAVRDNRPWWGGIIWASDYDSDTQKGQLGAADFGSYFDHRLVLQVLTLPAAATYVAGLAQTYTQIDQNDIARSLVANAQAATGGDIGVVPADPGALSGILRDRTYSGFDLKDIGSALRDLSQIIDGPDIAFDVGPPDVLGRPTRLMRVGTPYLGSADNPWVWELGGSMLSYSWSRGGGVMATRAFAQGTGTELGSLIAVAEDSTLYANGWPLLETSDLYSSDSDISSLQGHANSQLAALGTPLITPKITVRGDVAPGLDFNVGDFGRMIIPPGDPYMPAGVDLLVRVLVINVAIGTQGEETIKLDLQVM
jgi:hypothetical protein